MQYNKTIQILTNKHYLYSLRFSLSPRNRAHNSFVIALTRKRVSQSEIQSEEKQKRTLTSACVHVSAPFFNEWYMLMGHRKVCRINSENLLLRCIFFQRLHLFIRGRPSPSVRPLFSVIAYYSRDLIDFIWCRNAFSRENLAHCLIALYKHEMLYRRFVRGSRKKLHFYKVIIFRGILKCARIFRKSHFKYEWIAIVRYYYIILHRDVNQMNKTKTPFFLRKNSPESISSQDEHN